MTESGEADAARSMDAAPLATLPPNRRCDRYTSAAADVGVTLPMGPVASL